MSRSESYRNIEAIAPLEITSFGLVRTELEDSVYKLVINLQHTGDKQCRVKLSITDESGTEVTKGDGSYGEIVDGYGVMYYESGTKSAILRCHIENSFGESCDEEYLYKHIETTYPKDYYIKESLWRKVTKGAKQPAYSLWRGYTPEIPCVLLIGTSISVNYTPFVQDAFGAESSPTGKKLANVYRIPENSLATDRGVEMISNYLTGIGDDEWDVVHLNYGLHDLKYTTATNSKRDIPIEEYKANLRTIFNTIIEHGVKHIIWANTTWYPSGADTKLGRLNPRRDYGDEILYNIAAEEVCCEPYYADKIIYCDDHHAITNNSYGTYWNRANVHPNTECYRRLGESVTEHIKAALSMPTSTPTPAVR